MKATIKIDGMHCKSCVVLVTDALGETLGVEAIHVTIGSANVEFDEQQTSLSALKKAIAAEGYTVR